MGIACNFTKKHLDGQLHQLLSRLRNVRKTRTGFVAQCPCHDDRRPSLSITEANGRVLLHCHAGCRFEEIIKALGLRPADLFIDELKEPNPEAIYRYATLEGIPVEIVRFPGKQFKVRRVNSDGSYFWGLGGLHLRLYREDDVKAAILDGRIVFVVEGEKDAETLSSLGFTATTNAFGAGKWRQEYSEALRGG